MGLIQLEEKAWRRLRHWLMPLAVAVAAVLIEVSGDAGRELLRYDRFGVAGGQWFRLLSGHITHLGWPHLLMNIAGLALVWVLVGKVYTVWQWLIVVLAALAVIDFGFWLWLPQVHWYVGLSGLLHGLLAGGLIGLMRTNKLEAIALAAVLVVKLAYEALFGPLPGSEGTAGGAVVIEAHLLGAVGGVAAGLVHHYGSARLR